MVGPTVAVVDDDRGDRARTVRTLERGGYDVTAGEQPPSTAVDCLVTEVDLPGTDGLAVADRFRERGVAAVVYTGRGSEALASRAITLGVDEYVPKSRGPEELLAAVDRVLECGDNTRAIGRVTGQGGDLEELERFRTLVETVDDMIYTLDDEGTLTYVNRVFADYFGYTRERAIGTDVAEVLPEEAYESGQELVLELLDDEDTDCGRYEFRIDRSDGETHVLENNVVIYHDDGYLQGSAGVIRDVTRRTEVERELRRQNERLEEFADIVGHDLRNPLNVIEGRLELLRETGDLAHLEELEECTAHMRALLSDLLELARNGRDLETTEPVDLAECSREAWEHVETGETSLEFEGEPGVLEADPARLGQLLENLFRNAVEHGSTSRSEPGGSEDAVEHRGGTVTVEWTPEGFAVADDGPGIDPAVGEGVFERGVTTRTHGTGFGLSIVSSIVEAHGWSIALDDEYDAGARFVIRT